METIRVEGYDYGIATDGKLVWFRNAKPGDTLRICSQYGWRDGGQDRNPQDIVLAAPPRLVREGCPEWTSIWRIDCVSVTDAPPT